MNSIVLTIIILGIIALIAGILLSVMSILLAVKKDEKLEKIEKTLPGANCGGCGFSGCSGYANALFSGDVIDTSLCSAGGAEVAKKLAKIMGNSSDTFVSKSALVKCMGTWDKEKIHMEYNGFKTCAVANQLFDGTGACSFGCIGYGDCAKACVNNCIEVKNGLAEVKDIDSCTGCGRCIRACPKKIIVLVPDDQRNSIVHCMNKDKGAITHSICSVGCIGCGMCAKNCPSQAITMHDFLADIDPTKCTGCGKCEEVCPKHCIR